MQKGPLRQAPPLTVGQVVRLENAVFDASSLQDKVAAGYFCWLTFASSRFSDGQYLESFTVDLDPHGVAVVIGGTMRSKTSNLTSTRRRLLPLMALGWNCTLKYKATSR
eukprot:5568371-Amphidinium_carterae.1